MKRLSFALAAVALALGACETATPYQPRGAGGYGFSDQRLEQNRYRIAFSGNAATDRTQVEDDMLYRGAQLTLANGYDYFVIVDRGTQARTQTYAEPAPYYFPARFCSRRFGCRPFFDPFWNNPVYYNQITRYQADGEIVMHKGQKPTDDPNAFDAREVEANLKDKVLTPPKS